MKKRKHTRSASCDVKIGRSNSREYDSDHKMKRQNNHSRNNSRDFDSDFRQKLTRTHSRANLKEDHLNFKYILNYLKPDRIGGTDMSGQRTVRKHSRNHSYDQIYNMPNNIKLDQELHNKFHKNNKVKTTIDDVNLLKNSTASSSKDYVDSKFLAKAEVPTHSRTNSKDLNLNKSILASIVDCETTGLNILRHRRTNSKDLNRVLAPSPSASSLIDLATGADRQHARNSSQSRIQIEPEALLESEQLLNDADPSVVAVTGTIHERQV